MNTTRTKIRIIRKFWIMSLSQDSFQPEIIKENIFNPDKKSVRKRVLILVGLFNTTYPPDIQSNKFKGKALRNVNVTLKNIKWIERWKNEYRKEDKETNENLMISKYPHFCLYLKILGRKCSFLIISYFLSYLEEVFP